MFMKVKLQTDAFHYEGAHQLGVPGTILNFDIFLEPLIKPSRPGGMVVERRDGLVWEATLDVHNGKKETGGPALTAKRSQARAVGSNPIDTLAKLAENLRRVADALDKSLDEGITVPIKLHRRKKDEQAPTETGDETLEQVLGEGST